ncbi:tRNA (adenosine(37)-N6)-threonylcarbamoyltransferase complex dimerization subunit type 1 TsaB [Fructilactobacillus florum]|uniref:Gcp-like domain-containing protein n=1 Tax=Fructilactobacillus florum DSM 22689 = JCM 16035 TaxID=1423745 RepID=A0A0R2CMK3_9LACO|nr:tRNA (adenosine(37)-N6)-threonylcarbamoyltransferase complex dimerization subunit type 1 TsaB [Fructilactobacillus florum]KRM92549.1 hypothetical protein FC87_GL000161 [Fructilactobacillus florum DSM 22689 = JCM 16035]
MMKVLALDTSNRPLTAAVLDGNQLLATTTITTERKHAAFALPLVAELLERAHLQPTDLDRVVVANGPGSYTGLRVAVTIGKVLATTLKIQLVGISSLATLALNFSDTNRLIVPLFDARNDLVFSGVYQTEPAGLKTVLPDRHVAFSRWILELQKFHDNLLFVGQDTLHFVDQIKESFPTAVVVSGPKALPQAGELGLAGQKQAVVTDVDHFVPRYLRLTQAEADWQREHPGEEQHNYVEHL